jgi:putative aldouronate transport system permease protein
MDHKTLKLLNYRLPVKKVLWREILKNRYLYFLLLPTIVFYLVFAYFPMYGIIIAFKTFDYSKGIMGSNWNNFQNFRILLENKDFIRAAINTLVIGIGRLVIEFPIPIILALLLNEITRSKLKRIYQTIFTFPHFLSWVILSGIIIDLLSSHGIVNQMLQYAGLGKNTVLTNNGAFTGLIFGSNIWKEAGWSSILYLAAIAGINPDLYESANVDGANRFQQMKAITWPTIMSTARILLILAAGNLLNGGFDQIFNLYNPTVYKHADIIDTYIYRSAFTQSAGFGYATAVGLLKSVLNFFFLYTVNKIVKRISEEGGM